MNTILNSFLKWPQKQRDGQALPPVGTQTAGKVRWSGTDKYE